MELYDRIQGARKRLEDTVYRISGTSENRMQHKWPDLILETFEGKTLTSSYKCNPHRYLFIPSAENVWALCNKAQNVILKVNDIL